MNYSSTFIPTLREVPADAVIASHRLMFRSGMIRKLANGLFAYLPMGLRSFRKVEQIVREEMNAIGALEIKPTVILPGEIWKESGRWDAMGDALLRVKNRLNNDFVVSPTAEEAFTAIVRDELSSYRQLPLTLYQINTKYRDEIRPRYGVMRSREFVMKDAYSWHRDDESLDITYQAMGRAYRRIFQRCGLTVIPVKADSGAMGGSGSEEFMVESEIGDNTLLLCKDCDYAANVEKAGCAPDFERGIRGTTACAPSRGVDECISHVPAQEDSTVLSKDSSPLGERERCGQRVKAAVNTPPIEKIDTPAVKTIDELCNFLKNADGTPMSSKQFIKTLIYRATNVELDLSTAPGYNANSSRSPVPPDKCTRTGERVDGQMQNGVGQVQAAVTRKSEGPPDPYFFAVAIRGDLDVNEAKLAALVKAGEVSLAADADVVRLTNAPVGFAGPVGLNSLPVIVDHTVTAMNDAVTGALEKDFHYQHVAYGRDFTGWMIGDLRVVKAGDRCPLCGGELYEKKGNELGHIFKLGYKYTRSMNVSYLDENGKSQMPTMGCYGVGLDRALASVIEEHHDEAGIVWPVSVAPYHVVIIPIKYDGKVKTASDRLAAELEQAGVEVLLDDRDERPGVKFNDADLTGIPWRVVVGDKGLGQVNPQVEVKRRAEKEAHMINLDKAVKELALQIQKELYS